MIGDSQRERRGVPPRLAGCRGPVRYQPDGGLTGLVKVLPFHQLAKSKWADLHLPYQLADVAPPAPELVRRTEGQFRAHGLTVA